MTEGESSYTPYRAGSAPVCFTSPPVMGKSLLHRVSPCQKYLSAAIIWHREKVEGDSGCKVASCGCRQKRGPSYLPSLEVSPCISKGKAPKRSKIMWRVLFNYFSSMSRRGAAQSYSASVRRLIAVISCLLSLMAKLEAYFAQWCSKETERATHKHAHTVVFCNSVEGVAAAIPESILR